MSIDPSHIELPTMSSSKNPLKRFGFKRTNTDGGPQAHTTETELTDINSNGEPSDRNASISKIAEEFNGDMKKDHAAAVQNISEVEANRKLKTFRAEHNFDPNMPDAAFDAINNAVATHDQKGEAILVDELMNDSPYPEVCEQQQF